MNVTIDKIGNLIISGENELETYALTKWFDDFFKNDFFRNPDISKPSFNFPIVIKTEIKK